MTHGFTDRVFSVLQNNPSAAAGSVTFAVAFALFAGNAFFAQSGAHPDPIWSTRDLTTTQSVSAGGEPGVRAVQTTTIRPKAPPVPQTAPVSSRLVEDLQRALARTGDYSGTVDGLIGPVTRAAIAAYQERNGLPASGKPSPELLALVESRLPAVAARPATDPLSDVIANSGPQAQPGLEPGFVKELQSGLARATGQEIDVDGIFGRQTERALRAFQERNGLAVTGKPDAETLDRMERDGLISRG